MTCFFGTEYYTNSLLGEGRIYTNSLLGEGRMDISIMEDKTYFSFFLKSICKSFF
jgi:hypothetical protein